MDEAFHVSVYWVFLIVWLVKETKYATFIPRTLRYVYQALETMSDILKALNLPFRTLRTKV